MRTLGWVIALRCCRLQPSSCSSNRAETRRIQERINEEFEVLEPEDAP